MVWVTSRQSVISLKFVRALLSNVFVKVLVLSFFGGIYSSRFQGSIRILLSRRPSAAYLLDSI
jgi:hypothetical protein